MVTSKGFTKKKKFLHTCKVCRKEFYGADCKGSYCTECKLPKPCSCGCGIKVIRPNCFYASGHNPNSNTKEAHAKQALAITGENNPAKKASSRKAISVGVKNNHWTKIYPEQAIEHASLMRLNAPKKTSKLEDTAAINLPNYKRLVRIGFYVVDFVDELKKVIIEIQGCWHHCCKICFPEGAKYKMQKQSIKTDKAKKTYLTNRGWKIIYIWEHEIRKGNEWLHALAA